jgi:hypothetical protein
MSAKCETAGLNNHAGGGSYKNPANCSTATGRNLHCGQRKNTTLREVLESTRAVGRGQLVARRWVGVTARSLRRARSEQRGHQIIIGKSRYRPGIEPLLLDAFEPLFHSKRVVLGRHYRGGVGRNEVATLVEQASRLNHKVPKLPRDRVDQHAIDHAERLIVLADNMETLERAGRAIDGGGFEIP